MRTSLFRPILFGIFTLVMIGLLVPLRVGSNVSAQEVEEDWSVPINLSVSGATTEPVMVVDSTGLFHVIWRDEFAGFVYTTGDGVTWSAPTPVVLPSGDFKPWLAADRDGRIHAFWVAEENQLFHSRVIAAEFTNSASWSGAQLLSDSAVDLDVAVGPSGEMHLSYVRILSTPEFPAGLYYRRLNSGSGDWSAPEKLYESLYFRTLDIDTGHVDVAVTSVSDVDHIFVTWDNRPRSRIFLASSSDSGESWSSAQEIDRTEVGEGSIFPRDLLVYAEGERALLLWTKGGTGSDCVVYYQWSEDHGENWQGREQLFQDPTQSSLVGCPERIQILDGDDILFLLVESSQNYLVAWDGTRWSDPQNQAILNSFTDPETQNIVDFDCLQAVSKPGNQLNVVGCDTAIGGDTWFTERQITSVERWYPEEPVWSNPTFLTEGETEFFQPVLVSDQGNQIHAFWSQINPAVTDNLNEVIFYARQEATGLWTNPEEVLRIPEESLRQPAAAVDSAGNLLLVWTGTQSGKIYFSTAPANQAVLPTAWLDPVALPSPQSPASSPVIQIAPDGMVLVVYAVPLNQDRGIYLVQSSDGGTTWSDPIQVFDAFSAGWPMVDQPQLAITRDTHLHVLWTEYTLPSGPGPLALHYSRSEDLGASWSEHEQVIRKPAPWSGIVGIADQSLHRVWQEVGSGGITIWHDYSTDDGISWTRISPVSIFTEKVSSSGLLADQTGRLNLLQMVNRGGGSFDLQHWVWDGSSWTAEASLVLDRTVTTNIDLLATALTGSGELGAAFLSNEVDVETGSIFENISFTQRTLASSTGESPEVVPTTVPSTEESPNVTPTVAPTLPPTVEPEATEANTPPPATAGPTAAPTPTRSFDASAPINTGGFLGTSGTNLVIGFLVVVFIIALATGAWIIKQRRYSS